YFAAELKKAKPNLEDEHAPYLIALELDRAMRGWARRFGASVSRASGTGSTTSAGSGFSARSGSSSGLGSGNSSASGWTGGGGAFGGAGASTSWVGSVSRLASGYTRASSGSSS